MDKNRLKKVDKSKEFAHCNCAACLVFYRRFRDNKKGADITESNVPAGTNMGKERGLVYPSPKYRRGKDMFSKITRLQTRFFICYMLAIFIPIMFLSSVIYYYHNDQRTKEFLNEKRNSLITEQNYLENQLDSAQIYFNQLKSNYELQKLLRGFYTTEQEIVYAYNSQIYSLLSSIFLYDPNLADLTIYAENQKAAEILRYFEPISALAPGIKSRPELIDGFWSVGDDGKSMGFSFYIGFQNPPMTVFPGIARLDYNNNIFDSYAAANPEASVYVCLNGKLLYESNSSAQTAMCLENYKEQLGSGSLESTVQIIPDKQSRCILSSFALNNGVFQVIKITPEAGNIFSYRPFLLSFLVSIFILFCASIIMFLLIFRPFKNIVRLSEHMNRQNNHTLAPYSGKLSKDETGELILSFNKMTQRINELSSSLLNNEMQLKNAQIEALQAQLNPHFFYGTLESIRMIAEASHQELISDIAFSFGMLMRYSLSREYLVPVSREIDMTRQYVSIQEKRLVNRFSVDWQLCGLDDKWRCPKFVLFSMVENVFSHNVSKCRRYIRIVIKVEKEGEDLTFTVSNTGPGVSPQRLNELHYLLEHLKERDTLKSENNGRSIFNISDRLKLFYGEGYYFTIESEENVLTTCSVRIHRHLINF